MDDYAKEREELIEKLLPNINPDDSISARQQAEQIADDVLRRRHNPVGRGRIRDLAEEALRSLRERLP